MKSSDRIDILDSGIIAQDEERYLSFPDVVLTSTGALLAVYRDADIHYPADTPTTELVLIESHDQGDSWKNSREFPVYPKHRPQQDFAWHCPRLQRMSDGRIAFLCDITQPPGFLPEIFISFSEDDGKTWSTPVDTGARGIMPDRLLELSKTEWVFAYHWKDYDVGTLAEYLYATEDAGESWQFRSKVGADARYSLCEASLIQLPDSRLVAYLRENSFLHMPTYVCYSEDKGHTWSEPQPHPTSGHRPSAGVLDDGSVLLTYRNVAGEPGLTAWLGSADEIAISVSRKDLGGSGEEALAEGIRVCSKGGEWEGVEYTFPPLMEWSDSLELQTRLQRIKGESGSCVLRAGALLYVEKDEIRLCQRRTEQSEEEVEIREEVLGTYSLDTSIFHTYSLRLSAGTFYVSVDGSEVITAAILEQPYFRDRKVAFGHLKPDPPNKGGFVNHNGEFVFSSLDYKLERNDGVRHEFSWCISSGTLPDQYHRDTCVQLDYETCGDWEEAGYSGWIHVSEQKKFCIDYRRGEAKNPYIIGHQFVCSES